MNAMIENIRKGITAKEIIAVIVVTSLIWLYAEAESVATTSVETFVRVTAPAGADRVVLPTDPGWSGAVSIRLQGARGSIDAAKAALARGIDLELGAAGVPARPGQHNINLQTAIQNATLSDHNGVVVASVDPPTMNVDIESIVRIPEVPVRFEAPEGLLFASDIVIDPPFATVTAPQSIVDTIIESGEPISAIVRIDPAELEELPPGISRTFSGGLELTGGLQLNSNVTVTPLSAAVTLRIQSQLNEIVLPSVPIWEMIPPPEADNWAVTVEPQFITDLTLTGPADLIRRVESGEIRVVGVVELSSEILESGGGELGIQFPGLPPGLQVNTDSPRVTVTATRRPAVSEPATQ